ncbi:MAG: hypothetical protein ACJ0RL_06945 [Porticoccaceae bacterium]
MIPTSEYDALTDGLLLLRRMFGLTGDVAPCDNSDALVSGVIADNSAYPYPDDVERHFNILDDLVDIDGDGSIDALTRWTSNTTLSVWVAWRSPCR